jgi:hypothetical protein
VFYDEFVSSVVDVGTVATSPWTTITDTGTTAVLADAANGILEMSSAGIIDDTGSSIQLTNEVFDISSGNELWFETRLALVDADQTDVFAGFTINFITNPENVLTAADRIGFEILDESGNLICVTERSGTETRKICDGTTTDGLLRNIPATAAIDVTAATDPDDAGWLKLGIHVSGTNDSGGGRAEFYVNDVLVCVTITNIPDDELLSIALMQLNGEGVDNIMYADYIYAAGTR